MKLSETLAMKELLRTVVTCIFSLSRQQNKMIIDDLHMFVEFCKQKY